MVKLWIKNIVSNKFNQAYIIYVIKTLQISPFCENYPGVVS